MAEPLRSLPFKPIEQAAERQGGMEYLVTRLLMRTGPGVIRDVNMRLARARESGRIRFDSADFLCIEVLQLHPYFVYGNAWWVGKDPDLIERDEAMALEVAA